MLYLLSKSTNPKALRLLKNIPGWSYSGTSKPDHSASSSYTPRGSAPEPFLLNPPPFKGKGVILLLKNAAYPWTIWSLKLAFSASSSLILTLCSIHCCSSALTVSFSSLQITSCSYYIFRSLASSSPWILFSLFSNLSFAVLICSNDCSTSWCTS